MVNSLWRAISSKVKCWCLSVGKEKTLLLNWKQYLVFNACFKALSPQVVVLPSVKSWVQAAPCELS